MATEIDNVIVDLQSKLAAQEAEVVKSKQLINLLCAQYDRQPLYPDSELAQSTTSTSFATDEFYGQSLGGSMKKILEQRKAVGLGPATPREIYDVLVEGGYAFDTDNEQNRLTGVRVSLRKSSGIFHRLPDGKRYGLLEWYPKAKRKQNKEGKTDNGEDDDIDLDDTGNGLDNDAVGQDDDEDNDDGIE